MMNTATQAMMNAVVYCILNHLRVGWITKSDTPHFNGAANSGAPGTEQA